MAKSTGSDAKPDLRLVAAEAEIYDLMKAPETTADRVKRLQLEAHALALEEIEGLEKLLLEAAGSSLAASAARSSRSRRRPLSPISLRHQAPAQRISFTSV